jgi:hypothetical protein
MKIHRILPKWVYPLIVIPYIAVFWVSSYNTAEPALFGIPYFYWYQLLWVLISMGILAIAYFSLREVPQDDSDDQAGR